jgi:hypothetical protein
MKSTHQGYTTQSQGAKLDLSGGSTSYSTKQSGRDKWWKCGGPHKKNDYLNPTHATTFNPNPS